MEQQHQKNDDPKPIQRNLLCLKGFQEVFIFVETLKTVKKIQILSLIVREFKPINSLYGQCFRQ